MRPDEHSGTALVAIVLGPLPASEAPGARHYLDDARAVEPAHRHAPPAEARSLPDDPTPDSLVPTAQLFYQGNGNEHRRSRRAR